MRKLILSGAAIGLSPLAASPAFAQYYGDHGMWWGHGWGFGGMMFGGLLMIVFWGSIIVLAVLAVRWIAGSGSERQAPPRQNPLDVLKERFARGEIDKKEYEERRKTLSE
jgi:putative membrane protein